MPSSLALMASLALPLTALSVFLTRHNAEEERKKAESEKSSDDFLSKYGVNTGNTSKDSSSNTPKMQHTSPRDHCDILMLGSGWISNFAVPVIASKGLSLSATTRKITEGDTFDRIEFEYGADKDVDEQVRGLPTAKTVIIVFPIRGREKSSKLVESYTRLKGNAQWIQLGSTGIWGSNDAGQSPWIDKHTPPDVTNERCQAEEELLALNTHDRPTAVLNLAGLYGQERKPSNFLKRLEDKLEQKGSVHFVHGVDVARALIFLHEQFTPGERWVLTGRCGRWRAHC